MKVLGIETSCDDTGVAIYDSAKGLLAHEIYSQTKLHNDYGGVVPELASRDHLRRVIPLINEVLVKANLTSDQIDGVAYTVGPGLVGALLVGATIGRTLAWAWQVPGLGIHHMEAHLLAVMLEQSKPEFPFLALIVSGGHTMLVDVQDFGQYNLLGETLDDAAGEAFDKTAKLLGLPYPGGPELAKLAEQGDVQRFHFPRPMTDRPGLDFSFSGLKTFALNMINEYRNDPKALADIAAAFQHAIVETLFIKCRRALEQTKLQSLVIAGGVGANQILRNRLTHLAHDRKINIYYPRPEFCTDNGAMIAYVGCQRILLGQKDDLKIFVKPRWPL